MGQAVSPNVEQLIAAWTETIPESMRRLDVPGLAIGLCDADGPLWSAGFGATARGGDVAVTPATRFSVQSTSKLVAATTVMLAVRDGLVDLDVPICRYLPEFTVHSVFDERPQALITMRHLLSHTAGFTHEAPVGSNYDLGTGDFDEHCRSIASTWLRFPVGHHFEYSNLGIDLAAYVLQRVSGVPFAEYARLGLLDPLGLSRSTFDPSIILADPGRAIGHWRPFDEAGRALPVEVAMVAAGGLYTSVDDALRFVRLHLRHGAPLLPPTVIAEQYRVPFADPHQRMGYGLGVYLDEFAPGVRVLHHGGSGFGFQAQLCWVGDAAIGAVVLTNSFDHDLHNVLAHQFVEHVAREARLPSATRPASSESVDVEADALIGEWVGRLSSLQIRRSDGGIDVVRGDTTYPARPIGRHTIEIQHADCTRLHASEGRDGSIAYLLDLRDGHVYYRNEAATTPGSTLDPAYAGTYVASAWGLPIRRYRLAQDGASPVIQASNDPALRLTSIDAGHYLSSTGEVLDLTGPNPTYANIRLDPVSDNPTGD